MALQKNVSWVDIVVQAVSIVDITECLADLSCTVLQFLFCQKHHSVVDHVTLEVTSSNVSEGDVDKVAFFEGLDVFGDILMTLESFVQSHLRQNAKIVEVHVFVDDLEEGFCSRELVLGLEGDGVF